MALVKPKQLSLSNGSLIIGTSNGYGQQTSASSAGQVIISGGGAGFPFSVGTLSATNVSGTPSGNLTGVDVQDLISELESNKIYVYRSASSNPTVNDDANSSGGNSPNGTVFNVGDFWVNESTQALFVVFNTTLGAAVWQNINFLNAGFSLDLGDIALAFSQGDAIHNTWNDGGAITFTDTTKVSSAIDQLNVILGLLVPSSPPNFPGNNTLTIGSVGSLPLLANGAVPDNTSGGTLPATAGQSVTRVTASTVSTNTIGTTSGATGPSSAYVGPGNSGTITALVNNSASGTHTMTGSGDDGTYTNLVIAGQQAYPLATPGFWTSFEATISGAGATQGWNRYEITDTAASNTNTVYIVRDNITSVPTVSNGAVATNVLGTVAYSSGVQHFGTGSPSVTLSSVVFTNIAGETYYNGNPLNVLNLIVGPGTDNVLNPQSFSYANVGVTTPITRQTTTSSLNSVTFALNGSNTHTSAKVEYNGTNVNGTSSNVTVNNPILLAKFGTAQATQLDELNIPGSQTTGQRTYLGSTFTGDTPAGPLPSSAPSWTNTQSLSAVGYTFEAAVVGGTLTRDQNNYTTGYLPANTVNYTTKDSAQYFTFVVTKAAVSTFQITITGSYAGLWIGLPGVSDNATSSPDALGGAWWNAEVGYNGSGIPGKTGDATAGCGGSSLANGSSGTFDINLGAASSSSATNNRIIIRIRMNAGESITAISTSL